MLLKLTPGVNFINVLEAAFMRTDPECTKRQYSQQCRFTLLGPKSIKAACKMLMTLTSDVIRHKVISNQAINEMQIQ